MLINGFAKQNYTMLDNLKLGYGGTKTEMERLLIDAQKLTGVKYDINNLSDVYEAIHVIQTELGITGTTALEAEKTLTGSIATLKASWSNFLSGSGDLSQVVSSVEITFENVLRIVGEAVPHIIDNITKSLPNLISLGKEILNKILTGLISNLPILIDSAGQILRYLAETIINTLPQLIPVAMQIIEMLINGILSYLPQMIPMALQIIQTLMNGLTANLPQIIKAGMEAITQLIMRNCSNVTRTYSSSC